MYATVEQANAYVTSYYGSTDNIRVLWEALSDADKQVLLNRAEQVIDLLPYRGKPLEHGKAFPREPNKELSLQRAQVATIELAVQTHGNIESQERLALQKQGVKSYKIGDLSETFADINYDSFVDQFVLDVVGPYLRDWMGGSYRICHTRIRR
jgi:hypothetical protein